jgi:zinc protease
VQADRLMVGYKAPGQGDPDWAVLEFIAALLAGGPSSRLYRRLVIDTEMATSVDCATMPFRDPCLFRLGVNLTRGHRAEAALAEIDAAIAELGRTPVPTPELAKIKNCVETDFWAALEDCDGRAEALGHYETTLGDFRRLFEMADWLARIDADDIRRVAASYLDPRRRTIVIAEPDPDTETDDGDDGDDDDGEGELP